MSDQPERKRWVDLGQPRKELPEDRKGRQVLRVAVGTNLYEGRPFFFIDPLDTRDVVVCDGQSLIVRHHVNGAIFPLLREHAFESDERLVANEERIGIDRVPEGDHRRNKPNGGFLFPKTIIV